MTTASDAPAPVPATPTIRRSGRRIPMESRLLDRDAATLTSTAPEAGAAVSEEVLPRIRPRERHPISESQIDPDALKVLYRLRTAGYKAYLVGGSRSEERRVGKECRSRWSRDQYKKKMRERER